MLYVDVILQLIDKASDFISDDIWYRVVQFVTNNEDLQAMKCLRPKQPKESHTVTFLIGLFTGCFLALFGGYIIMARIASPYTNITDPTYMETIYPIFQVPLLRQLEYVICYYVSGSFRRENYSTCTNNKHYKDLVYVVSVLPYYWRAMQCARRWFDEGDLNHIANLGKYVSAMVAAGGTIDI